MTDTLARSSAHYAESYHRTEFTELVREFTGCNISVSINTSEDKVRNTRAHQATLDDATKVTLYDVNRSLSPCYTLRAVCVRSQVAFYSTSSVNLPTLNDFPCIVLYFCICN